jgi:hypothetical protein
MNKHSVWSGKVAKLVHLTTPTIDHQIVHGNLETVGRFGNSRTLVLNAVENFKRERVRLPMNGPPIGESGRAGKQRPLEGVSKQASRGSQTEGGLR